ncbi:MAG: hypothetical protein IH621_07520 [Krumholzibacteria bacterium]|nr:hypothetical protein [Candidatus Krumholzibacteria bacterium]
MTFSFGLPVRLVPLAKGLATRLPGGDRLAAGTVKVRRPSAAKSYAIWLKHLGLAVRHGMEGPPASLVEIGPGGDLGVGLAALLSGADHYRGLDVVPSADLAATRELVGALAALFAARAPRARPGWPETEHLGDTGAFPRHILDDARLARALDPQRLAALARLVGGEGGEDDEGDEDGGGRTFAYVAPWDGRGIAPAGTVGMVVSHAVMQHVDDPRAAYRAVAAALAPGGYATHQIDFCSMNLTRHWNGHWGCPDGLWAVVRGRRPYLINRLPLSGHLDLIRDAGTEVVAVLARARSGGIPRRDLAEPWRSLGDDDLNCAEAFIVSRARG